MNTDKAQHDMPPRSARYVGLLLCAVIVGAAVDQLPRVRPLAQGVLSPIGMGGYLLLSMALIWQPVNTGILYSVRLAQIGVIGLALQEVISAAMRFGLNGLGVHDTGFRGVFIDPRGLEHAIATLALVALHGALLARSLRRDANTILTFLCWGFAILALYHLTFGILLDGSDPSYAPTIALWLGTIGITLRARNTGLFSSLWTRDEAGRLLRVLLLAVLLCPLGLGLLFAMKVNLMVQYTLELELVFGSMACLLVPLIVWLGKVLQDRQALLLRLAHVDPLTGALNRTGLEARLGEGHKGLLLFDLDHFKRLNDTYGHAEGDRVLQEVAHRVSRSLSEADILARWGGEEFLILTRDGTPAALGALAERTRTTVEALPPLRQNDMTHNLTISVGYGRLDQEAHDFTERLARVDRALYAAKSLGRNRAVCADEPEPELPFNPELLKLCERCDRFGPPRKTA